MRLADILSDMIANGATLDAVSAVVEASRRQDDAKETKRRQQTALRVKAHRERNAGNAGNAGNALQSLPEVPSEVPPQTPLPTQPPNLPDNPPSPPKGAQTPTGVSQPPVRGSRIDPNWSPDLTDLGYAAQQGMGESEIGRETEKFRDFWAAKAGADASKRDWHATWRTWVRNTVDRRSNGFANGARAGPAPPPNPRLAAADDLLAKLHAHSR